MSPRSAFRKDIAREILHTFGRFAAIFAIVALGVAFYAGIGATGGIMKLAGDMYFDEMRLMDVHVLSTLGLTRGDVEAIAQVEGVESVHPGYTVDVEASRGDSAILVKASSLQDAVNLPRVVEGRLPETAAEAAVESRFMSALGLSLGDEVELGSGSGADIRAVVAGTRATVVGVVESPYYISQERGGVSIGNGRADAFMLLHESAFRRDLYSEAFVVVQGACGLPAGSDEYKALVDSVVDRIESLGERRSAARRIDIVSRARDALDAAEAEALGRLGAASEAVAQADAALEAQGHSLTDTARGLDESWQEAMDGVQAAMSGQAAASAAMAGLDDATQAALAAEVEAQAALAEIDAGQAALSTQAAELASQEAAALAARAQDPAASSESATALADARRAIAAADAALSEARLEAQAGYDASNAAKHETLQGTLEALSAATGAAGAGSEAQAAAIAAQSGKAQAIAGENEAYRLRAPLYADAAFAAAEAERVHLEAEEGRREIEGFDEIEWHALDRETNPGYLAYAEDADKIDAIGRVFPAIFFVVAALVSLTTMTRLVEERRGEIGTLKSLGFGGARIMSKYVAYAAFPTMLGGVIGGYAGIAFLPATIMGAYAMMYAVPMPGLVINAGIWGVGVAIAAVSTLAATALACMNELRSQPAALLRPKAPKAGKRIFLERIWFVWRSLSFIQKVTCRNVFRYKKRFLMTVVGIAGCTSLLMTGFGLRDSITSMLSLQYGRINGYDLKTSFEAEATSQDVAAVEALFAQGASVASSLAVLEEFYDVGASAAQGQTESLAQAQTESLAQEPSAARGKEYSSSLLVVSDAMDLAPYISLSDRVSGARVPLRDDAAVITEKLSRLLGVGLGDLIYISDEDGRQMTLSVGGIAEMYYMHYVFVTDACYEGLFGEEPEPNTLLTRHAAGLGVVSSGEGGGASSRPGGQSGMTREEADEELRALASEALEMDGVTSVQYTSTIMETFHDIVGNLDFVVVVLIVSAGALAFVVLLNLTGINIAERMRELATTEVLGFYDREVSAYVYRENAVLTAVGIAAGLVLGVALHRYVILTAETEPMMFGRDIGVASYAYSAALTVVFSALVNMLTARKLRRINMVEALKSLE